VLGPEQEASRTVVRRRAAEVTSEAPVPQTSERRRRLISHIGGQTRHDPDGQRLVELRRDLAAVQIEEFAERTLAKSPPLTREQRARLRALFADEAAS
jgi:hypothetical protein